MTKTPKTKRGLLITTDGLMTVLDVPKTGDLKPYYELIGTDIVERTEAKIADRVVEVWCDEEGLFKADAAINPILYSLSGRQIVGHVVLHSRSLDTIVTKLASDGWQIVKEVAG